MSKFIDLKNQKFSRLKVVEYINHKKGHSFWLCQCDCGNNSIVSGYYLRHNLIRSCGCLQKENIAERSITHNLSKSNIYKIYIGMKQRCYNKNSKYFTSYGGRGITVCDEWLNDFMSFYNWALANGWNGEKLPNGINKLSIDRINNNLGYSPDNCRWVTMKEQQNNRRNNQHIIYKNETHTYAEWEKITGIPQKILCYRITKFNWTPEKTLETPSRKTKRRNTDA